MVFRARTQGGNGIMVKYEKLKASFKEFQGRKERYVEIPKDFLLEIMDELLRLRRRDAAKAHREQVYRCAVQKAKGASVKS